MGFMKTRHTGKLSSVADVLRNKKTENSSLFKCIQLNQNWTKIIGEKWGHISKPIGYTHRCLMIRVPSSCHVHEMSFDKEVLIERINKFSGSDFIQDIHWIS